MSRPDPIEYAERLYEAIRDANFSPISFLAFGNAIKDGVPLRRLPRIAAHLRGCAPCRQDFEGLLAAARAR